MMGAIVVGIFVLLFIITLMTKAPNISNADIAKMRAARLKEQADRRYLEQTDPRKFEFLVADVFEKMGYQAEVTKGSNDGGKDIILRKDGEVMLVEVKRYCKSTIGRPLIQKLHSACVDAKAAGGYFVTLSQFNKNAREYAKRHNIELVDGNELIRMMNA